MSLYDYGFGVSINMLVILRGSVEEGDKLLHLRLISLMCRLCLIYCLYLECNSAFECNCALMTK